MPRFRYVGGNIANNVAGHTWNPGDVKTVLDELAYIPRTWPAIWLEVPERDGGAIVLGQSAVQVACVSTGEDESLYALLIPAGTLGPNDELQIEPYFRFSSSTDDKFTFVKTALGVDMWRRNRVTGGQIEEAPLVVMSNRNALNSQVYVYGRPSAGSPGHFTGGGQNGQTTTIDFSLNQTIIVGGQREVPGDALTLERVRVTLWPGSL